jgi:hypothetical protein
MSYLFGTMRDICAPMRNERHHRIIELGNVSILSLVFCLILFPFYLLGHGFRYFSDHRQTVSIILDGLRPYLNYIKSYSIISSYDEIIKLLIPLLDNCDFPDFDSLYKKMIKSSTFHELMLDSTCDIDRLL